MGIGHAIDRLGFPRFPGARAGRATFATRTPDGVPFRAWSFEMPPDSVLAVRATVLSKDAAGFDSRGARDIAATFRRRGTAAAQRVARDYYGDVSFGTNTYQPAIDVGGPSGCRVTISCGGVANTQVDHVGHVEWFLLTMPGNGAPLLRPEQIRNTRTTEAMQRLGIVNLEDGIASLEQGTGRVGWVGAGEQRWERIQQEGGRPLLFFEGAAENLLQNPLDISLAGWSLSNAVLVGPVESPSGSTNEARAYTATVPTSGSSVVQDVPTVGESETLVFSVFYKMRTPSGTRQFRLRMIDVTGGLAASDKTITPNTRHGWQRAIQFGPGASGSPKTVDFRVQLYNISGGTPAWDLWGFQLERNRASSLIRSGTRSGEKAVLNLTEDEKLAFQRGRVMYVFYPTYAEADWPTNAYVIEGGSTAAYLRLNTGSGGSVVWGTPAQVVAVASNIEWAAGARIEVILDWDTWTMEVRGLVTGDGVYAGTPGNPWDGSSDWLLGDSTGGGTQFWGHIDLPVQLGSGEALLDFADATYDRACIASAPNYRPAASVVFTDFPVIWWIADNPANVYSGDAVTSFRTEALYEPKERNSTNYPSGGEPELQPDTTIAGGARGTMVLDGSTHYLYQGNSTVQFDSGVLAFGLLFRVDAAPQINKTIAWFPSNSDTRISRLIFDVDGKLTWEGFNGAVIVGPSAVAGQWYQAVAFINAAGQWEYWLDGALVGTAGANTGIDIARTSVGGEGPGDAAKTRLCEITFAELLVFSRLGDADLARGIFEHFDREWINRREVCRLGLRWFDRNEVAVADPGDGFGPRYLFEDISAGNLLVSTEDFDAAAYDIRIGATVEAGSTEAPDGGRDAKSIAWGAAPSRVFLQTVALPDSTTHTFSAWARKEEPAADETYRVRIRDKAALYASGDLFAPGREWKRYAVAGASGTGATAPAVGLIKNASVETQLETWGWQLETGAYPTSYQRPGQPRADWTGASFTSYGAAFTGRVRWIWYPHFSSDENPANLRYVWYIDADNWLRHGYLGAIALRIGGATVLSVTNGVWARGQRLICDIDFDANTSAIRGLTSGSNTTGTAGTANTAGTLWLGSGGANGSTLNGYMHLPRVW